MLLSFLTLSSIKQHPACASNPYEEPPTAPSVASLQSLPGYEFAQWDTDNGMWYGVFETTNGYVIEHGKHKVTVHHVSIPGSGIRGTMLNLYKGKPFFDGAPYPTETGVLEHDCSLAVFRREVQKFGEILREEKMNRFVPEGYVKSPEVVRPKVYPERSRRDMDSDNGLWGGPSYNDDEVGRYFDSHMSQPARPYTTRNYDDGYGG